MVFRWMEAIAIERGFNVALTVVSSYLAAVGVVGPASRAVLSELTKEVLSNEKFPHRRTKDFRLAGVPTIFVRCSKTGLLPLNCAIKT